MEQDLHWQGTLWGWTPYGAWDLWGWTPYGAGRPWAGHPVGLGTLWSMGPMGLDTLWSRASMRGAPHGVEYPMEKGIRGAGHPMGQSTP